ncbi:MarR family winged helix-turn-helix transcriptional regulator [Streptomyces sp. NPDC002156]
MQEKGLSSSAAPVAGAHGSDETGVSLLALTRAYLGTVDPILSGLPHGARGYHTLGAVIRGDHPSQLALATWLGIDRSVMTYLLDDLVAAGLVERRQNPADRRQRKIVATALGAQSWTELQSKVLQAEAELLGALDDQERDAVRDLLNRAVAGLPNGGGTWAVEC